MDYSAIQRFWQSSMTQVDPWLAALLEREERRQFQQISLGAASSLCPSAVREAQASVFSNVDAEGYPPKRMAQAGWEQLLDLDEQVAYYQRYGDSRFNKGTELANVVEVVAQRRAAAVFSTEWANNSDISVSASDIYVNLQCPTGSLANTAVFEALLKPEDVVLSMNLVDGGHLSHGSPLHRSGKTYKIVHYGVDPSTQRLDYDQIRDLIQQYHPRLIVGGASSYPWAIDWKRFRQIAEEAEPRPYILADISHPAGLVAAGLIPNPIAYADAVTFTTYKTFCGPRGAAILSTDRAIAESIDRAVFPGLQSSPVFQQIAALAVAFEIAKTQEFKLLQHKIAENARLLHQYLTQLEIPTAFGGTNTHIVIADVGKIPTSSKQRATGDIVARLLERVGISCNSNLIPGDKYVTLASGIRLGTTWISQLGYGEAEVREIAAIIADLCKGIKLYSYYGLRRETPGGKVSEELLQSASQRVKELLNKASESGMFFEQKPVGSSYAKAQPAMLAPGDVDRGKVRNQPEGLIVSGERAASFLQSVITRDIYKLKQGEAFSALVLNTDGEKRLDVLVRCLSSEPHPSFLLVYQHDHETHFCNWLQMLSHGFVEVERDDPYVTLDGPVVIKSAGAEYIDDTVLALAGSETDIGLEAGSLIEGCKPYFIGQTTLPKGASPDRKWFAFEEAPFPEIPSRPSPLYNCHKALGATFTNLTGYELPLYFTSSSQEHEQVRKNAGLFDLSHRVLLGFQGQGAERFLDLVLTEHIPQLGIGGSCRTCILSPEGMLIRDCILYRLELDYFMMELEPFKAHMVENWLQAVAHREVMIDPARPGVEVDRSCSIVNLKTCSDALTVLGLQGPKSTNILQCLLNETKSRSMLHNLKKGQIIELPVSGIPGWIARRGYTGEMVGYELFVPQSKAAFLWNTLMAAGLDFALEAIGLNAADSLRIEAGLPLYGKDLAGPYHISPLEAGLGSSIKLDKPFFIGRQQLLSCSPSRRMVRLRAKIDAATLAKLEPTILNDAGNSIGVRTSAASVSGQFYGLGLLDEQSLKKGEMYLSSNGTSIPVEVLSIPYSTVIEA
jgi:glycine hydroxymethyltransferase